MNWFYFGILLAVGFWMGPAPSEAFIARSTGCHHNGTWYADKSLVPTVEKCLNCQCSKKTLVCRLKVCPEMPMPPPRGCVVVQKRNTCCPYLSCARLEAFYKIPITRRIIAYLDHYERESIDRVVNENMLQRRSDDSEADLQVCVKNGTVYKSGSAMSSSNLCSYCYCIGGTEKCVKPKCMLPVEGCKPIFVDSTCCPVRYDCSAKTSGKSSQEVRYRKTANKHFLRMSQRLQRNRGCTVNKQFYAEGQKMKSDPDKPCDICFCIRGSRRCAPKKCSPALKNCIPVVPKGQCCPSSYDCGSQRDYRRSHNSRQFNLFSLLFGKDDNQPGPSTVIPAHYPHDRDPALTSGASKYKTHEQALEASSEKSILDTIKEGLEFIDGNTKHMLEENFDLVNLQAKRESVPTEVSTTPPPPAAEVSSTTTELSLLDLILYGEESSSVPNKNEEISVSSPSTPVQDELSWVDILLGPSEEQQNVTKGGAEQNATSHGVTSTPSNINRIDVDVEEVGSTGEIFIGTTEALTDTTTESLNVANSSTTTSKPAEMSTRNNSVDTIKPQNIDKSSLKNVVRPAKPVKPIIRPIPLHDLEDQSQQTEYIPIKEIKLNRTKVHTTSAPIKENNLLTAFLDGISGILNSEKADNISSSTTVETKVINSTTTPPTLKPSKSPPVFKLLPTQKTQVHTRINSKIASLVVSPPTLLKSSQQQQNKTNKPVKPLPSISPQTESNFNKNFSSPPSTTSSLTSTSTSTTSTTTTRKPTTTTQSTTLKPVIINTNPTILEAEPLDDSTEPTLPPSLPNLKIIPFLPTDAVEAANTKPYDYFPSNAQLYEDTKLYPDITKNYGAFALDMEDDNKAKYIYKFKVEGPEVDALPEAIPKAPTDAVNVDGFVKYDFADKNGFSPPTKTEGGFVPKEPLPIDGEILVSGEFNASQLNEIFPATMHIIDLTTPETFKENFTKIIEITTPDPFKDVIHTEPPPDLALIIQDKVKIEAMAQKAQNSSFSLSDKLEPILLKLSSNSSMKPTPQRVVIETSTTSSPLPMVTGNKNSIESFLDLLFKEEDEAISYVPVKNTSIASTIPPFKSLPQTTVERLSVKPTPATIVETVELTTVVNQSTRRPLRTKSTHPSTSKNRTKANATRKPTTTTLSTKDNKFKTTKTPPATSTSTSTPAAAAPTLTTQMPTPVSAMASTTISVGIKTTSLPISSHKPTKSILPVKTTTTTTSTTRPTEFAKIAKTTETSIKTTHNPFLMSPFDKLPFMDASFEVKRQQTAPTFLASATQTHSLERLEGLNAAYEISNAISSKTTQTTTETTTTTTTKTVTPSTVHPPYSSVNEKHSISTSSNSLIDPTGILKLAGCNIYGRMYRVGRIILELSSPCVECKCTETGVKCGQLDC